MITTEDIQQTSNQVFDMVHGEILKTNGLVKCLEWLQEQIGDNLDQMNVCKTFLNGVVKNLGDNSVILFMMLSGAKKQSPVRTFADLVSYNHELFTLETEQSISKFIIDRFDTEPGPFSMFLPEIMWVVGDRLITADKDAVKLKEIWEDS